MKPKLLMLVGLSSSGKSNVAKHLSKEYNANIVSSDDLRLELFGDIADQSNNELVFREFHKRIIENISNNKSVVADATNITIKSRRTIIDCVKRFNCEIYAFVLSKAVHDCIQDNEHREKKVATYVIDKQLKKFQIPFYEEGFDCIKILNSSDDVVLYKEMQNMMKGFEQNTKWHKHTLDVHCSLVASNYTTDKIGRMAGRLHDIGKLLTGEKGGDGNYHYFNHENVGTYFLLQNTKAFINNGWTQDEFLDILFIVNYHMFPFSLKTNKAKNKWRKVFGEEKFKMLTNFNKYNKMASAVNLEV